MAKNFIDNLSEETRKGLREKAEMGIFPSGSITLGYKLAEKGSKKPPQIDENNNILAIKLFNYYATDLYSIDGVLNKLKEEGFDLDNIRTPRGVKIKKLGKTSADRILKNPFYYGDFVWNGKIYKGIHEPLIDKELFDKVQNILNKRKRNELINLILLNLLLRVYSDVENVAEVLQQQGKQNPLAKNLLITIAQNTKPIANNPLLMKMN